MIHVETLMGASHSYICRQLFIDTFLTVFIAFILSILVMGDILSLFNYFFDARLTFGFILSWKVFPFILLLCFSFGHYTGHLYDEETEPHFYQRISAIFSREKKMKTGSDPCSVQMVISIGLMTAFMMIRTQLSTIEEQGERFKGILILGNEGLPWTVPLYNDIKNLPVSKLPCYPKGG